jgi:EAL domain-containing protein (putative c-di-GMP-specific phosphodiesterase class I)
MISPNEFIPIAERKKLIIPIGDLIIDGALRFLTKLRETGRTDLTVSINISTIQLLKPDFEKKLLALVRNFKVDPQNIEIEVTESVFAANLEDINEILGDLKASGISIAIDDFGTGYSSLAREIEINASCLKIDKYFIDKLLEIEPQNTLVSDIMSMGHKLGYYIVAEGVEHGSQLEYLKTNGCDKAQGYFISKPLDEDKAIDSLMREPGR